MKLWRKMSGARTARAGLTCSLLFVAALCFAGPYADLRERLSAAASPAAKYQILSDFDPKTAELQSLMADASSTHAETIKRAEDFVSLAAVAETNQSADSATGTAKKIKASPLYADAGEKQSANWLGGAIKRLQNLFQRNQDDRPSKGNSMPSTAGLPQILTFLVWMVLGAGVLAVIFFLARHVSFSKLKKRSAKAMLEDDEPERTLDEWLQLADSYEREGRLREAVRALYLACLLRFDEHNIARFVRGQTNWEHLQRIEGSAKLPAGFDFRSPTQAFDQIWYGHKLRGPEDVREFRAWYLAVTSAMRGIAA